MGADHPDWTLSANITAGRVTATITNATIPISGTVSISAGTVTIQGNVIVQQATTSVFIGIGQLTSTGLPVQYTAPQLARTLFGTGTTGTVTYSTNLTITKTVAAKNLTVAAAVTIQGGGYGVLVSTTATTGATSVLTNSGKAGTAQSTSGGPKAGGLGGAAGTFAGGAQGGKVTVHIATAGGNTPFYTTSTKPTGLLLLQGGAGGLAATVNGHTGAPKTGGKAGIARAVPPTATQLRTAFLCGGAGGGGCTVKHGAAGTAYSNASGGGGGGAVVFGAHKLKGGLKVVAKGGTGKGITTAGCYAIAGSGGGGAAVLLAHTSRTWTGSITNAGGTTTVITGHTAHSGSTGHRKVQKVYNGQLR